MLCRRRLVVVTMLLTRGVWSFFVGSHGNRKLGSTSGGPLHSWNRLDEVMESVVLKTLFPDSDRGPPAAPDPREILATFELATLSNDADAVASHESITNYLQLWGRQLELKPDKGLTTPILTSDFENVTKRGYYDADPPTVTKFALPSEVEMALRFRPAKRYLSYKEQKGLEKGVLPDRKGGKVDAWSPGGIQLIVGLQTLAENDEGTKVSISLTAKRYEIDGDTVIKFASERAIIRRLKEAVRIWTKVREMR